MITAKEARQMVKDANDNELKKFKVKMQEEIEKCARYEMNVAKVYFNIENELQLERANKVMEELTSNGFVCELYKNSNYAYPYESGILSAKW